MGSQTLTASDPAWAWPAGVTTLTAKLSGSGGGGTDPSGGDGGSGGSGGWRAIKVITKTQSTLNITVGGTATHGNTGNDSKVMQGATTEALAPGGDSGTSAVGTTTHQGGNGGPFWGAGFGGGGGGSGSDGADGNDAGNPDPDDFGTGLGDGGQGSTSGNGDNGVIPGGGAGGGADGFVNGSGARGQVELSWTDPPASIDDGTTLSSAAALSESVTRTQSESFPFGAVAALTTSSTKMMSESRTLDAAAALSSLAFFIFDDSLTLEAAALEESALMRVMFTSVPMLTEAAQDQLAELDGGPFTEVSLFAAASLLVVAGPSYDESVTFTTSALIDARMPMLWTLDTTLEASAADAYRIGLQYDDEIVLEGIEAAMSFGYLWSVSTVLAAATEIPLNCTISYSAATSFAASAGTLTVTLDNEPGGDILLFAGTTVTFAHRGKPVLEVPLRAGAALSPLIGRLGRVITALNAGARVIFTDNPSKAISVFNRAAASVVVQALRTGSFDTALSAGAQLLVTPARAHDESVLLAAQAAIAALSVPAAQLLVSLLSGAALYPNAVPASGLTTTLTGGAAISPLLGNASQLLLELEAAARAVFDVRQATPLIVPLQASAAILVSASDQAVPAQAGVVLSSDTSITVTDVNDAALYVLQLAATELGVDSSLIAVAEAVLRSGASIDPRIQHSLGMNVVLATQAAMLQYLDDIHHSIVYFVPTTGWTTPVILNETFVCQDSLLS